jgi:DNA-binding GntR family transcriptional regulator
LHPLRHTSAEALAQELRREILHGGHAPGAHLRQNDIAARFGVSSTPVREAFALLQADGLVEIDRYRGTVVFRPTARDLRDSYEIRQVLEMFAVAKAIPHLTRAVIAELQALLEEMRAAVDVERWMQLNDHFHLRIYAATNNPRLTAAIAAQHASASMYIYMHMTRDGSREEMDTQHLEILDACRERDIVRAQEATRVHLQSSVAGILRLLDEEEARRSKHAAPADEEVQTPSAVSRSAITART